MGNEEQAVPRDGGRSSIERAGAAMLARHAQELSAAPGERGADNSSGESEAAVDVPVVAGRRIGPGGIAAVLATVLLLAYACLQFFSRGGAADSVSPAAAPQLDHQGDSRKVIDATRLTEDSMVPPGPGPGPGEAQRGSSASAQAAARTSPAQAMPAAVNESTRLSSRAPDSLQPTELDQSKARSSAGPGYLPEPGAEQASVSADGQGPAAEREQLESRIRQYHALGMEAVDRYHLSRPEQESALWYAREIESLDPEREEVALLMGAIQGGYIALVLGELGRGNTALARMYAELAVELGVDEQRFDGLDFGAGTDPIEESLGAAP